MIQQPEIKAIFNHVCGISREIDIKTQSILNITQKTRKSLLPWRGQFSPQLIEYILTVNSQPGFSILDPFCGSGTTLFESARLNLSCYGADINPAAHFFSSMVIFSRLNHLEREHIRAEIINIVNKKITQEENNNLMENLLNFYQASQQSLFSYLIASTSIILAMGNTETTTITKFFKSLNTVLDIVEKLPYSHVSLCSLLNDARYLNIPVSKVNLIITSPPYINVFNYHQNYRKALEFLNWQPLQIAASEIGANRKHRANRFLTVIQYCMDMCETFLAMRRFLEEAGKVIIVVGRTSSVRNVQFENSYLLAMVATGCTGFKVEKWQERFFTNRFGEKIYEDILTLSVNHEPHFDYLELARYIGIWFLQNAKCQDTEVKKDIEKAIASADKVAISPKLNLQIPSTYNKLYQSFHNQTEKQILGV